jgi:hypothetical protein
MAVKNDQDPAFLLVDTVDMILNITESVYNTIKVCNEKNKDFNKDMLSFIGLSIDNGIIEIATGILILKAGIALSKLILGSDGSVTIQGSQLFTAVTTEVKELLTPTPMVFKISMGVKTGAAIVKTRNLVKDTIGFIEMQNKYDGADKREYL